MMTGSAPPMLVSTDWLAAHLDDPELRILDATVHITRRPDGKSDARSGKDTYLEEHIPGAQFADVLHALSDRSGKARFTIPSPERFATAMESLGVGDDTHVVVYSATGVWWATRVWWLLRYHGFERVSVLDGGLGKWTSENRPVTSAITAPLPAKFTPRIDASRIALKETVLQAIMPGSPVRVLDVLSPEYYRGEAGDLFGYGRLGHIAGAYNRPTDLFMHPDGTFRVPADIARIVEDLSHAPVITYCGGGIAATQAAFALELSGLNDVRVYDGSLEEWAADPDLPMRTGPD
nr:sulfurtransferase [uncultured Hyphomonas sp.]